MLHKLCNITERNNKPRIYSGVRLLDGHLTLIPHVALRERRPSGRCTKLYLKNLKASSFIDGSMLYGSDYEVEDKLREWSGGRLKVEYVDTSLDTKVIQRIPLGLEL